MPLPASWPWRTRPRRSRAGACRRDGVRRVAPRVDRRIRRAARPSWKTEQFSAAWPSTSFRWGDDGRVVPPCESTCRGNGRVRRSDSVTVSSWRRELSCAAASAARGPRSGRSWGGRRSGRAARRADAGPAAILRCGEGRIRGGGDRAGRARAPLQPRFMRRLSLPARDRRYHPVDQSRSRGGDSGGRGEPGTVLRAGERPRTRGAIQVPGRAGLIEAIPDSAIAGGLGLNVPIKQSLGIYGRVSRVPIGNNTTVNRNGNDGTIARFGWKAQNKSLLIFSGEAYNVEMGISNELFQSEREEDAACQAAPVANDVADLEAPDPVDATSAIEKFSDFMRFLAPPTPSTTEPGGYLSITSGRTLFGTVGCAHCHTPTMTTGNSPVAALRYKNANLFSDLALHKMGPGLADDIIQGQAAPDEFRTAPLWGLGKRIFFLHDGRTADLLQAIHEHRSAGNSKLGPSEAIQAIDLFDALAASQKQEVRNFLRSL